MRWDWTYPAEDECCTVARHTATRTLRAAHLSAAALGPAAIVVGELAANAIQHARTPFRVAVDLEPVRLRVVRPRRRTRCGTEPTDSTPGIGALVAAHDLAETMGQRSA